ncbi:hypothetical protein ACFLVI_02430 [Chloroflexota bacterium]
MPDKRMLIVPADLVKKVDDNRGDLSQADFIDLLIESKLNGDSSDSSGSKEHSYITSETFEEFEQGIRDLLRSFLDFFISYGLELGKQPSNDQFEELNLKLQNLGDASNDSGQRTIKWKH